MRQQRGDRGQFTEEVALDDVLAVFEAVAGPVVTSGDIAEVTGCSRDSARRKLDELHRQGRVGRRKTAGRVVYWRTEEGGPAPVNPDDPFFVERTTFASGRSDLSERVDEIRESTTFNVLEVGAREFDLAAEQFARYDDQDISFVDHLGGVLAAEHDIEHVVAFDRDLATLGFTRVPVDTDEIG